MLCRGYVLNLKELVTALCSVLLDVSNSRVCTNERAELIVCCAVCILGEVDDTLDNGCLILCNHSLAVGNLKDEIALSKLYVLNLVWSHGVKALDIVAGILVHGRSRLILA